MCSLVAAPRERVWERVTTPEGVNAELMPIVRMALPPGIERLDVESVPVGTPIGRCRLLLFGLIPFDWDDLTLERLEAPAGFHEVSSMASMRIWEHERTLEPVEGGCRVTDRVGFLPRVPFPAVWVRPLFRTVFRHRHRRLRAHFGELHQGS